MAEKENIILGISLGTRRLGMAVGSQNELIDWQMKVFAQTYSKKKARKIWRTVEQTILKYGITVIGMKLSPNYSRTDGLSHCIKYISEKAIEKGIVLFFYDLQAIADHFLKSESISKKEFAEKIAEKYPELKREIFKMGDSLHNFKMFEAVASMDLALLESFQKQKL